MKINALHYKTSGETEFKEVDVVKVTGALVYYAKVGSKYKLYFNWRNVYFEVLTFPKTKLSYYLMLYKGIIREADVKLYLKTIKKTKMHDAIIESSEITGDKEKLAIFLKEIMGNDETTQINEIYSVYRFKVPNSKMTKYYIYHNGEIPRNWNIGLWVWESGEVMVSYNGCDNLSEIVKQFELASI